MSCFFCSNALIAFARSLCKCLLAVLITAREASRIKLPVLVVPKPYDVNWACELCHVPDILCNMQVIAVRLTCLSSKNIAKHHKLLSNPVQMCPQICKTKTQTDMHKLTSSEHSAFASDSRKQNSVFHMTAVLHMAVSDINCGFCFVWFGFK